MAEVKNNTHFMYGFTNTFARYEATAAKQVKQLDGQIENDLKEVRRLEKEKLARMQEFSLAANSSQSWGFASSIANNVTAITGMAVGAACYMSSEVAKPAAYLLGAAGAASMANRLFSYMGWYEKASSWMSESKEMQETIASRLEQGLQFASHAMNFAAGGYLAYNLSVIPQTAASIVSGVTGGCAKAIEFGKSFADKKSAHIRSDMQYSELSIHQIYQRLQQSAKEGERLSHSLGDTAQALKDMIHNLNRS